MKWMTKGDVAVAYDETGRVLCRLDRSHGIIWTTPEDYIQFVDLKAAQAHWEDRYYAENPKVPRVGDEPPADADLGAPEGIHRQAAIIDDIVRDEQRMRFRHAIQAPRAAVGNWGAPRFNPHPAGGFQ